MFDVRGLNGGRTRARTWDPLIKSQLVFETNQQLSKTKAVKPACTGQWLSSDLSNRLGMLRSVILIVAVALLALCASVETSRAELQMRSSMDDWCQPAKATGHTILRWKAPSLSLIHIS